MTTDDIRARLERLARRGRPRGAPDVLAGARAAAGAGAGTPDPRSRPTWTPMALVASVSLLVVGVAAIGFVGGDDQGGGVAIDGEFIASTRLEAFADCEALLDYAKEEAEPRVGPFGLVGTMGGVAVGTDAGMAVADAGGAEVAARTSGADAAAMAVPTPASDGAGSGAAFSETNVQERGVDEPDTVKTDGRIIYTLARGRLWALSVADHRVLGSVEVAASDFFLAGDRIIALGAGHHPVSSDALSSVVETDRSTVTVVDVSDPAAPQVRSRTDLDGQYVSARLVNGTARIVTTSSPRVAFAMPRSGDDHTPAGQARMKERNDEILRRSSVDDWLPRLTVRDPGGERVAEEHVACDATYRPPEVSGLGFINVMTLNTESPEQSHIASVMADGQTVYATGERLYVATGAWGDIRPLPAGDTRVAGPPAVQETLIHQFDISDAAGAAYRKSGKVRGHVLNQFSMSEHDGMLRVATTDSTQGGESFVTVLGDQGEALAQVGQVGGLGRGERIYAVRFMGPVGYVVTFRQVDPLYTLDLRDPTRPRVVGELKITGYSAYLHPVGDGRLLGVGQEASLDGRRQGTQVSLFDVSDAAAPKRLAQYHLPGGDSPAEFDHHAFLYWDPARLAVVPFNRYDSRSGVPVSGAVGLRAGDSSLDEVGQVTHRGRTGGGRPGATNPGPPEPGVTAPGSTGATEPAGPATTTTTPGGPVFVDPGGPDGRAQSMPVHYEPPITRSLVIGDRLYTVSEAGILASDLGSFRDVAWVPLA